MEGYDKSIRSTIRIGDGTVDVIKNGPAKAHMVFEENKTNVSCYATPFGQMMVGNTIEVEENPDRIAAVVDYTLDINYEKMSSCRISIDIQSKETADFHLTSS